MKDSVELWKKHPYIGKLEVSSFGMIRSVKGHYYKICPINSGYLQMQFRTNGKHVHKLIHRLVAETFIPNPNRLPQVNHKDGDGTNNNVGNLEWCTASYNIQYREKFGISTTESQGHPVFAINLTTLEIFHFGSQWEVSRELGFDQANINKVVNGKHKQAYGFWFANDDENSVDVINSKLHEIKKMED